MAMNRHQRDAYIQLAQAILDEEDNPRAYWQRISSLMDALEKAVAEWKAEDRLPSTAHFFPAGEGQ